MTKVNSNQVQFDGLNLDLTNTDDLKLHNWLTAHAGKPENTGMWIKTFFHNLIKSNEYGKDTGFESFLEEVIFQALEGDEDSQDGEILSLVYKLQTGEWFSVCYPQKGVPELDQRHALMATHAGIKIHSFADIDAHFGFAEGEGTVDYFAAQNCKKMIKKYKKNGWIQAV